MSAPEACPTCCCQCRAQLLGDRGCLQVFSVTWASLTVFDEFTDALVCCRQSAVRSRNDIRQQCSKCGLVHPTLWFHAGSGPLGLHKNCKPCRSHGGYEQREKWSLARDSEKPVAEKRCSRCMQTLPVFSYLKNIGCKDGLNSACQSCQSQMSAAWYKERREHHRVQPPVAPPGKERICGWCKESKAWSEFHALKTSNLGIQNVCKQCQIRRQKKYKKQRSQTQK